MDLNIKVSVPAIEKLVDYTASGIGSVAGMMLTPARARKEAEALRITAGAMADARKLLTTSNTEIQGQLTVGEMIALRVQFQEEKRQANISGVFSKAVEELHGAEVEDHEPDHDWTARFFNY